MRHTGQVWMAGIATFLFCEHWVAGQMMTPPPVPRVAAGGGAMTGDLDKPRTLPTTVIESVPVPYKPVHPPSAYDPSRRVTADEYYSLYEITGNYQVNKTRASGDDDAVLSEARRRKAIMEQMAVAHVYSPPPATTSDQLIPSGTGPVSVSEPEPKPASSPNQGKASNASLPPENVEFVDMRSSSGVTQLRLPRVQRQPNAPSLRDSPPAPDVPEFNIRSSGQRAGGTLRMRADAEMAAPKPSHPLAAAGPPTSAPSPEDRPDRSSLFNGMNRRKDHGTGEAAIKVAENPSDPVGAASRNTPEVDRAVMAATRSSQENTGFFARFRSKPAPQEAAADSPEMIPQPKVISSAIPIAEPPSPPAPRVMASAPPASAPPASAPPASAPPASAPPASAPNRSPRSVEQAEKTPSAPVVNKEQQAIDALNKKIGELEKLIAEKDAARMGDDPEDGVSLPGAPGKKRLFAGRGMGDSTNKRNPITIYSNESNPYPADRFPPGPRFSPLFDDPPPNTLLGKKPEDGLRDLTKPGSIPAPSRSVSEHVTRTEKPLTDPSQYKLVRKDGLAFQPFKNGTEEVEEASYLELSPGMVVRELGLVGTKRMVQIDSGEKGLIAGDGVRPLSDAEQSAMAKGLQAGQPWYSILDTVAE